MFKIGEFSKLSNLSIRTLHHYEAMGILTPSFIDTDTNYRFYSADKLKDANQIKSFVQIGLSLKEIKSLLIKPTQEKIHVVLEKQMQVLEEQEKDIVRKKELLKSLLQASEIVKNYNVKIKTIPSRRVLSIRKILPTYYDEHLLWKELYDVIKQHAIQVDPSNFGMSIYHDEKYKEQDVDIEVQVDVKDVDIRVYNDTTSIYDSKEYIVASTTFHGDYEQMTSVNEAIAMWIDANDYQLTGIMMIIPHISPATDKNPNNWVSEACYEIKQQ